MSAGDQESLNPGQQVFRGFVLGENSVRTGLGRQVLAMPYKERQQLIGRTVLDFLTETRRFFRILIEGGKNDVIAARTPELASTGESGGAIQVSAFFQRPAQPLGATADQQQDSWTRNV